MTKSRDLTKAELKFYIEQAYQQFLDAGAVYREMRNEHHAPGDKLRAYSQQAASIGFTLFYHSRQKNNHFGKLELAQTYLDLVTVTHQMWEEIAEAAAKTVK